MQWQPIETAPKDGTEVLLAFDGAFKSHVAQAWYSDGVERPALWVIGSILLDALQAEYLPGTPCAVGLNPEGHKIIRPSKWMPLPEVPE